MVSIPRTTAFVVATAAALLIHGGCQSVPPVASAPVGVAEQVSHAAPREGRKTLLQSSRKAAARTGEAIVGVATTAGRFVGWVVKATIGGFFDDDDDAEDSDPVRARRDRELNDWTESRDKWLREERARK